MQPAVITFRPDNFLTIGLMGAIAYAAAVLLWQLAMRAGIVGSISPASTSATATPTVVV